MTSTVNVSLFVKVFFLVSTVLILNGLDHPNRSRVCREDSSYRYQIQMAMSRRKLQSSSKAINGRGDSMNSLDTSMTALTIHQNNTISTQKALQARAGELTWSVYYPYC